MPRGKPTWLHALTFQSPEKFKKQHSSFGFRFLLGGESPNLFSSTFGNLVLFTTRSLKAVEMGVGEGCKAAWPRLWTLQGALKQEGWRAFFSAGVGGRLCTQPPLPNCTSPSHLLGRKHRLRRNSFLFPAISTQGWRVALSLSPPPLPPTGLA